jgi:hypothetical protein
MKVGFREGCPNQAGYTYLMLLLTIALTSAGLAVTAEWHTSVANSRRLAQLDWAGSQLRDAIGRYYEASPGSERQYPEQLEHLLLDPRFLYARRHLRELYAPPATIAKAWLLIPAAEGGIKGVAVVLPTGGMRYWGYGTDLKDREKPSRS